MNPFEKAPGSGNENPKIQICPNCGGTGKDKDGKSCSPCRGTGKISANR
jgi:DnaJ-class molecular chaperone